MKKIIKKVIHNITIFCSSRWPKKEILTVHGNFWLAISSILISKHKTRGIKISKKPAENERWWKAKWSPLALLTGETHSKHSQKKFEIPRWDHRGRVVSAADRLFIIYYRTEDRKQNVRATFHWPGSGDSRIPESLWPTVFWLLYQEFPPFSSMDRMRKGKVRNVTFSNFWRERLLTFAVDNELCPIIYWFLRILLKNINS